MTDLDALRVRGTPELLADLKEREENRMDSRKLTDYAVAHGVELPDFYTPDQLIGMILPKRAKKSASSGTTQMIEIRPIQLGRQPPHTPREVFYRVWPDCQLD